MKLISENKTSQELINSFNEEIRLQLAKRVEEVDYINLFDDLKDRHLQRTLAINRPELTTNYIHLFD